MHSYRLVCFERSQIFAVDAIEAANLSAALNDVQLCYPGRACQLWEGDVLLARTDGVLAEDPAGPSPDRPVRGGKCRWTIYL